MYVRNVTQDSEKDVDEEIGAAAALEEDTKGREEDGEDDLDDVAVAVVSGLRDEVGEYAPGRIGLGGGELTRRRKGTHDPVNAILWELFGGCVVVSLVVVECLVVLRLDVVVRVCLTLCCD